MDEKRIDTLEKRVDKLDENVGEIRVSLTRNEMIAQQGIETAEKLSNVIDSVEKTMIKISDSIDTSNENIKQLNDRFERIDSKVELLDDKTKFDISTWVKQNFVLIVIGVTFIGYIIKQTI